MSAILVLATVELVNIQILLPMHAKIVIRFVVNVMVLEPQNVKNVIKICILTIFMIQKILAVFKNVLQVLLSSLLRWLALKEMLDIKYVKLAIIVQPVYKIIKIFAQAVRKVVT